MDDHVRRRASVRRTKTRRVGPAAQERSLRPELPGGAVAASSPAALLEELTTALTAADTRGFLTLLVERCVSALGTDAAAVLGAAPAEALILLAAADATGPEAGFVGRRFEARGTAAERALRSGRPTFAGPDAPPDSMAQTLVASRPISGVLAVPLVVAGMPRGVLVLVNPSGGAACDYALASMFGHLATVALERRRTVPAHGDAPPRLLQRVFRAAAAAVGPEGLPSHLMEALLASSPADRAELYARMGGNGRLLYARPARDRRGTGAAVALHELGGRQLRPVTFDDPAVAAAARQAGIAEPYGVVLPLVARGRILGTVLLARASGPYTAAELDQLSAVGFHFGLVLEHTWLIAGRLREEAARPSRSSRPGATRRRSRSARSRWLSALGEVAAGVAHDLNNALHPIVAFAELLRENAADPDPELVRAYAEKVLLAARDGAEIVRRVQRFTRRAEDPAAEPVELAEVVRQALDLTRATWAEPRDGAAIEVVEAIPPGLTVAIQPAELRQALLNLISNSVDAMPKGGTLRFVGRAEDDHVLLAVQDTGEGMPLRIAVQAPEPFFTTKGMHGTGLGLSEVYGIARRQGGSVELESWPGVGTTVLLRLPATNAAPQPAAATATRRREGGRTSRILLVDDNLLGLEAIAASLRAAGHTVVAAANAKAALEVFEPGGFEYVISDVGMPGLSGWDLLDRIRAMDEGVRLGIITGWALQDGDPEVAKRPVHILLQKPVDPDTLLALLEGEGE